MSIYTPEQLTGTAVRTAAVDALNNRFRDAPGKGGAPTGLVNDILRALGLDPVREVVEVEVELKVTRQWESEIELDLTDVEEQVRDAVESELLGDDVESVEIEGLDSHYVSVSVTLTGMATRTAEVTLLDGESLEDADLGEIDIELEDDWEADGEPEITRVLGRTFA